MAGKKMKSKWAGLLAGLAILGTTAAVEVDLGGTFDLSSGGAAEPQTFRLESRAVEFGTDGSRKGTSTLSLELKYEPGEPDTYTCIGLTMQQAGGTAITIPALAGWSYQLQDGNVPVEKFQGLTDENGNVLPPQVSQPVMEAFTVFHQFCTSLCEPVGEGQGIEDLTRIGDRIVHDSSFTERDMSYTGAKEGSVFRVGETILELKGLTVVDGSACAVIGYDSGEGSLRLVMEPMPNMQIKVVGAATGTGDLYVDLATNAVKKVTMTDVSITKVTMGAQALANPIIRRTLTITEVGN